MYVNLWIIVLWGKGEGRLRGCVCRGVGWLGGRGGGYVYISAYLHFFCIQPATDGPPRST